MPRLASVLLGAFLLFAPLAAHAAGGDDPASPWRTVPEYVAAKKAVDNKNWPAAITALQALLAKDPKDADVHNYLGYAQRHLKQYDAALASYRKALELDAKHRGAHEYIGETYLLLGDLAKAEEHLARLDSLCFFGCEEYRDLKAKIAAFKKTGKTS
jgi:tetratricopeptide (TPR) repeat protein